MGSLLFILKYTKRRYVNRPVTIALMVLRFWDNLYTVAEIGRIWVKRSELLSKVRKLSIWGSDRRVNVRH